MKSTNDGESTVLDKWQEWLQEGAAYVATLREERDRLMNRVQEIDAALAMPAPWQASAPTTQEPQIQRQPAATATHAPNIDKKMSIPAVAREVIRAAGDWVTAAQITQVVKEHRSDIETPQVHAAIYALRKRGEIEAQGPKGQTRFRLRNVPSDRKEDSV